MSLSVRNESASAVVVGVGIRRTTILPGDVATVSDEDWARLPAAKRGDGALRPLYPSSGNNSEAYSQVDYFSASGTIQMRYFGKATQGTADDDASWIIWQYDYTQVAAGDVRVSRIQVLDSVTWADRATLDWMP
jgi:hypothetical protein